MSKRSIHDPRTNMPIGLTKFVSDWLKKNKIKSNKIDVYEDKDKLITHFKVLLDREEFSDALNVDKAFITIKLKRVNK